jgi:uncharacterized protein YjbJ (UPF0337 family)
MNTNKVTENWNKTKGKLKQKFVELTDNDLFFAEGMRDEMIGRLQIKLGKTKAEMRKIIESL